MKAGVQCLLGLALLMSARSSHAADGSPIALLPQAGIAADLQHRGSLFVGLAAAHNELTSPWGFGVQLSAQAGLGAGSLALGPTLLRGSSPGGPVYYRIDLSGRLTRTWLLASSPGDVIVGADVSVDMFLCRWGYLRVSIGAAHDTAATAEDVLTPNIGLGLSFLWAAAGAEAAGGIGFGPRSPHPGLAGARPTSPR